MVALFGAIVVATLIILSFMRDVTRTAPASELEAFDRKWLAQAQVASQVLRQLEMTPRNEGLAQWMA